MPIIWPKVWQRKGDFRLLRRDIHGLSQPALERGHDLLLIIAQWEPLLFLLPIFNFFAEQNQV